MTPVETLRGDWSFPTAIRFGAGRRVELPEACRAAGITRPLLVTDPGLAALPMLAEAQTLLDNAGLPTTVFSEVKSNPVGSNVVAGRTAYRAGGHDGVVGLGGGSVLDVAKVIALMAGQERDLWDFGDSWRTVPAPEIAPVVAVPTTAGTGSEVGRAAVVTHEAAHTKKILLHPGMMPRAVIADPELTLGLPPFLTAATGFDALAHNLEAFCAPFYHPLADGIALEALRLLHRWLFVAYRDGQNLEARAHVLAAATMGATAFQKGLGAVHALSHPVGAIYDVHHGLTNAVFLPYVLVFNRPAIEAKMAHLARYLDLPRKDFDGVLTWILELRDELDIPHTLAGLDVGDERLEDLAAMAAADPCAPENPVLVDSAALERLYRDAHAGRLP